MDFINGLSVLFGLALIVGILYFGLFHRPSKPLTRVERKLEKAIERSDEKFIERTYKKKPAVFHQGPPRLGIMAVVDAVRSSGQRLSALATMKIVRRDWPKVNQRQIRQALKRGCRQGLLVSQPSRPNVRLHQERRYASATR